VTAGGGGRSSRSGSSHGPSDEEIRAAAEVAGVHRVSTPGVADDLSPSSAERGRSVDRPGMDFWAALYERRTTRRFDPERPVPRELILELLDAALIAPTSCNLQMWDFVVVDDPDQRERLGHLSLQILTTPVTIFVAYGREYSEEGQANIQSAAAALMNMSLAAHVLGLGTFWINQVGPRPQVGKILGLPPDREVVAALGVGWPKVYPSKVPRRRPFDHVVHWNHATGQPTPSSPHPRDWTLTLIRNYQQARVLNGNRYNKSRPWELQAALSSASQLAPRNDDGTPDAESPLWLDVLPVHGMFTGAMARQHRSHRWAVLELSQDVADFAAKRCPSQVACRATVWPAEGQGQGEEGPSTGGASELPDGSCQKIICLNRLESLPPVDRPRLLAELSRLLAPDGRLLLRFVSSRSFHAATSWLHSRRGGPGGVEYVLAPDPNLGPFEALDPGEVLAMVAAAGLAIESDQAWDVVPPASEVDFRTRNMGAAKAKLIRTAVSCARLLERLPGIARWLGRSRTLVLHRP
jgi:nitroreductase